MFAEDAAHRVGNLAERRARLDGCDDGRDEIRAAARRGRDRVEGCAPFALAASGADGTHALHLDAFRVRVDAENVGGRRALILELVHADDDRVARVDGLLCTVRRVLNLPLDVAGFNGCERTPDSINLIEQLRRLALDT